MMMLMVIEITFFEKHATNATNAKNVAIYAPFSAGIFLDFRKYTSVNDLTNIMSIVY